NDGGHGLRNRSDPGPPSTGTNATRVRILSTWRPRSRYPHRSTTFALYLTGPYTAAALQPRTTVQPAAAAAAAVQPCSSTKEL
ncbi:hypothetical protein BGX34_000416, partial [Mortierella sp. NVP85]